MSQTADIQYISDTEGKQDGLARKISVGTDDKTYLLWNYLSGTSNWVLNRKSGGSYVGHPYGFGAPG